MSSLILNNWALYIIMIGGYLLIFAIINVKDIDVKSKAWHDSLFE